MNLVSSSQVNKFQRFLGVGSIGFAIDFVVFFTIVRFLAGSPIEARIAASLVAIMATWLLNRSFTFATGRIGSRLAEFLRYLLASAAGAGANLAVIALVSSHDAAYGHLPSYVLGAAAGLVVNFVLYDVYVFYGLRRERPTQERRQHDRDDF